MRSRRSWHPSAFAWLALASCSAYGSRDAPARWVRPPDGALMSRVSILARMRDETIRLFTMVSASEASGSGGYCFVRGSFGEDVRTFDAMGRVTTVASADHVTALRYEDEGKRVIVETRARGDDSSRPASRRAVSTYEGAHLAEQTRATGAKTCTVTITYDARGCLASERDSCLRGEETRFTCDASGRVVRVEDFEADGSLDSGYDVAYDEQGRRSRFVARPDGRVLKQFTYDDRGRLVTDGNGLRFEYDDAALTVTIRAPHDRRPLMLTHDYSCRLAPERVRGGA